MFCRLLHNLAYLQNLCVCPASWACDWMAGFVLVCVVGFVLFKLFYFAWTILRYFDPIKHALSKRHELRRAGDWAIITGSTDGIGRAFAEELASDGLNIFLISRNAEKLLHVSQDLEHEQKVQTKYFVADFTKGDFYEALKREIDALSSVACLINNVGMSQICAGPIATCEFLSTEFIQRMIFCNAISTACMTRITMPKMLLSYEKDPKHPPCIINMSSVSAIYPRPYKSLYAACKSFVQNFSASVSGETRGLLDTRIRFLTLTPGFVWTPSRGEKKVNFFKPTPELFANSALGMIGVASQCCGFMPHELMVFGLGLLPGYLRDWVIAKFELKQREKFQLHEKAHPTAKSFTDGLVMPRPVTPRCLKAMLYVLPGYPSDLMQQEGYGWPSGST
ncbi:Estradiol 17-beta-dehydrogenase [Echinococcus granulosus]|uniref:Estradiol 17-beta-dehydrogenase n=1 Tax=Echinococcus granulosus TaxID=6210 RepID=W6V785_ECHGR|nr:Estradiol 17-beta-dehydrogenase [Echinococcus granulosus]EUB62314.1 Estradiol 17-beta-dehydrogenase [Echinococcus granulosus]